MGEQGLQIPQGLFGEVVFHLGLRNLLLELRLVTLEDAD